jgi:hypothetical protein
VVAGTLKVTSIWYRYIFIMAFVWVGVRKDVLWMYEVTFEKHLDENLLGRRLHP